MIDIVQANARIVLKTKTINAYLVIQTISYILLTKANVYNAQINVQHAKPSINVNHVTMVITNLITNVSINALVGHLFKTINVNRVPEIAKFVLAKILAINVCQIMHQQMAFVQYRVLMDNSQIVKVNVNRVILLVKYALVEA